jgi:hypothetical protein
VVARLAKGREPAEADAKVPLFSRERKTPHVKWGAVSFRAANL